MDLSRKSSTKRLLQDEGDDELADDFSTLEILRKYIISLQTESQIQQLSDHFRACNEQKSMKSGHFYWIYIAMTDVIIFVRCHSLSISLVIDCYLDSQSGLYSKEKVLK